MPPKKRKLEAESDSKDESLNAVIADNEDVEVKTERLSQDEEEGNGPPEKEKKKPTRNLRPRKTTCYTEKENSEIDFEEVEKGDEDKGKEVAETEKTIPGKKRGKPRFKRPAIVLSRWKKASATNPEATETEDKEKATLENPDSGKDVEEVEVKTEKLSQEEQTKEPSQGDKGKPVAARKRKITSNKKKVKPENENEGGEKGDEDKKNCSDTDENQKPVPPKKRAKPRPKKLSSTEKLNPTTGESEECKEEEKPVLDGDGKEGENKETRQEVLSSEPKDGPTGSGENQNKTIPVKKRTKPRPKKTSEIKQKPSSEANATTGDSDEKVEKKVDLAGLETENNQNKSEETIVSVDEEKDESKDEVKSTVAPAPVARKPFFRGRRSKFISARSGRKEVIHKEETIDPEDIRGYEHVERYTTPAGIRLPKFWDSEDEMSEDENNDNFRRIMCGFGTNCRIHEVIRPASEIVRRLKELQNTFGATKSLALFQNDGFDSSEDLMLFASSDRFPQKNPGKPIMWHNDPSFFKYANNYPKSSSNLPTSSGTQ